MKLKCLIVDDEPIARDIIENHIAKVNALELYAKCSNAFEAINILHHEKIDVMFLDIKMPSLSGLDMLKTLERKPKVILTTAYSEFGAESYEYGVTDYLMKPVSFERFLKAVNKILLPQSTNSPIELQDSGNRRSETIFFKADKKIYKFSFNDLLYIKGSGNYVKIFSETEKPLMVLDKLSILEHQLPPDKFLRVHKSYIINIAKISHLEGNRIKVNNEHIPIGQMYKDELLKRIA